MVFLPHRTDHAAALTAFQLMEKRAKLLIADSGDAPDPPADLRDNPMYNTPTLAAECADAFVPSLFTERGKQPITAGPEWERLDVPYGQIPPMQFLKAMAEQGPPAGTRASSAAGRTILTISSCSGRRSPTPCPTG